MSEAVPLFSLYAVMAWTRTAIAFSHMYDMLQFHYTLLR